MSILVLIVLFASVGILRGQEFVREGESWRYVDPIRKSAIVVSPKIDTRPVWIRALLSLRPWVSSSPGTRLGYNEELDLYELDGSMGIGLRGKVEF